MGNVSGTTSERGHENMEEKKVTLKSLDEFDELRMKEKTVTLTNQNIIELGYLTKDMIECVYGHKLSFEEANCYHSCFYTMRKLLKQADAEYRSGHGLDEFFFEDRELDNSFDIIRWATQGEIKTDEGREFVKQCLEAVEDVKKECMTKLMQAYEEKESETGKKNRWELLDFLRQNGECPDYAFMNWVQR